MTNHRPVPSEAAGMPLRGLPWACRVAGLLTTVTGQDVRLTSVADGYRLTLATPADRLLQGAVLPILGATARWGHSSRTGLWCEVDT